MTSMTYKYLSLSLIGDLLHIGLVTLSSRKKISKINAQSRLVAADNYGYRPLASAI